MPEQPAGRPLASLAVGSLTRTPEPELMLEPEQAKAYSEADFAEAHDGFVEAFRRASPTSAPRRSGPSISGAGPPT